MGFSHNTDTRLKFFFFLPFIHFKVMFFTNLKCVLLLSLYFFSSTVLNILMLFLIQYKNKLNGRLYAAVCGLCFLSLQWII